MALLYDSSTLIALAAKKTHAMVPNPLYEAADDHYEHLPDCKNHTPSSHSPRSLDPHPPTLLPIHPNTSSSAGQLYNDVTPQLPPPRKDSSGDKPATLSTLEKSPQHPTTGVQLPESHSLGSMSAYSGGEDCYTVMSPAGTITMLPRLTVFGNGVTGHTKCADDSTTV